MLVPWRGGVAGGLLERKLQLVDAHAQLTQQAQGGAFAFANHAQQQVLGADIVVPQADGLLPAQGNNLLDAV